MCSYTVYSGHLEWPVGRYLVVVRYLMVDCPRWAYQSCWKMEREWKNQTMLLALNMCKRNKIILLMLHTQFRKHIFKAIQLDSFLLQLQDSDGAVLARRPRHATNILSTSQRDQLHPHQHGGLHGVLHHLPHHNSRHASVTTHSRSRLET